MPIQRRIGHRKNRLIAAVGLAAYGPPVAHRRPISRRPRAPATPTSRRRR